MQKIDFESQILAFFAKNLANFAKNLANFVSLPLKIDNPYYHIVEKWKLEGKLDNRKAVSKHSKEKD